MKTMKNIILIYFLTISTALMAEGYSIYQTSSDYYQNNKYLRCEEASTNKGVELPTPSVPFSATVPNIHFQSTSAMYGSGSTLCSDNIVEVTGSGKSDAPGQRRRVNPNQPPSDPFDDPIGDAVLPLLLLALGYVIYLRRKNNQNNSLQTPDSRL